MFSFSVLQTKKVTRFNSNDHDDRPQIKTNNISGKDVEKYLSVYINTYIMQTNAALLFAVLLSWLF